MSVFVGGLFVFFLACLHACLRACLLACLLASWRAGWLVGWLAGCLLACFLASLLPCFLASLLACLLPGWLAGWLACLLACLLAFEWQRWACWPQELAADDAARGDCVKEGRCALYNINNVTIPSDRDVRDLIDRLELVRETELRGRVTHSQGAIMKESMKLALLSYARNEGKGVLYNAFQDSSGSLTTLELQMKSLRHDWGEEDDTAHVVVYLIRDRDRNKGSLDGFGVVLAYKGSTNDVDWEINMDTKPVPLFPDLPDKKEIRVHRGFLGHKQRLDETMQHAPMAPLKKWLKLWGVETDADPWMVIDANDYLDGA
eukprot:s522_g2.t1